VEVLDSELQLLLVIQIREVEERHCVSISSTDIFYEKHFPFYCTFNLKSSYDVEEEIPRWVLLLTVLQAEWVYNFISALNNI